MSRDARVRIEMCGEPVPSVDAVHIRESVTSGVSVAMALSGDSASKTKALVLDPISISIDVPHGAGARFELFCREQQLSAMESVPVRRIVGCEPLALAGGRRQFTSREGRRPILEVVGDVLRDHVTTAAGEPIRCAGTSPAIAQPWLLQASETGLEFCGRLARGIGAALYWDRTEYRASPAGRSPQTARTLDMSRAEHPEESEGAQIDGVPSRLRGDRVAGAPNSPGALGGSGITEGPAANGPGGGRWRVHTGRSSGVGAPAVVPGIPEFAQPPAGGWGDCNEYRSSRRAPRRPHPAGGRLRPRGSDHRP